MNNIEKLEELEKNYALDSVFIMIEPWMKRAFEAGVICGEGDDFENWFANFIEEEKQTEEPKGEAQKSKFKERLDEAIRLNNLAGPPKN